MNVLKTLSVIFFSFFSHDLFAEIIRASDAGYMDEFGASVAISNNVIAVGAPKDNVGYNSIDHGSAYLYTKNSLGSWTQAGTRYAKFFSGTNVLEDISPYDKFGYDVDVWGTPADGGFSIELYGSPYNDDNGSNSGSVYFKISQGINDLATSFKVNPSDGSSGDIFGFSVSLNMPGFEIVIGSPNDDDQGIDSGSVYVYESVFGDSVTFPLRSKLTANDGASIDRFGYDVDAWDDYIVVGAPNNDQRGSNAGAVYVYKRSNGLSPWVFYQKLTSNDLTSGLGVSVSISDDVIVAGAYYDDEDGESAGAAYVFHLENGVWVQKSKLLADDGLAGDNFGRSVDVFGGTIIVGSPEKNDGRGKTYIYSRSTNSDQWIKTYSIHNNNGSANDNFGKSVSVSILAIDLNGEIEFDGYAIAASIPEDDTPSYNSGSVYVLEFNDLNNNAILSGDFSALIEVSQAASGKISAADLQGIDSEFDDTSGFSVSVQPANGVASINNQNGSWLYTPNNNFVGIDNFTVAVTDLNGGITSRNISVTVDVDDDDDGILNSQDNCTNQKNLLQGDLDNDGVGDACDDDLDGDGFSNIAEDEFGGNPLDGSDADIVMAAIESFSISNNPINRAVPAMGGIGLLALGLSMLGLGAVRLKKK
ncbi:Ig-like domain-containing protein [Pseudomonadales bacterium]|nr:Ig-like domain-containing protein [Pseudomonadales bacterium]